MSDRRSGRDFDDPRSPRDARDFRDRRSPHSARDPQRPSSSRHRERPPEPPTRDRHPSDEPRRVARDSRDPRARAGGQTPSHRSGAGAPSGRARSRSRSRWEDEQPSHRSSRHHEDRRHEDHYHDRYDDGWYDDGADDEWYDDADARYDEPERHAGGYHRHGDRRDAYGRPAGPTRPREPWPGPRDRPDAYDRRHAPAQPPYYPSYDAGYGVVQDGQPNAWRGYGQPGARTRPMADGPANTPPAWAGRPPAAHSAAPPRRASRRGLWITLGVLGALLLALAGGGAYAFDQYLAPGIAAGAFCGALEAHHATIAYGDLTATMQAQLTEPQFGQGTQVLDTLEGPIVKCAGSTSGAGYGYHLGSGTATISMVITRATAGALRGNLRLSNENGAWKVAGLDTSLLGADLGALATASAFCAALQGQDYTSAYGLLASAAQQQTKAQDFTQAAQIHDQIDGKVTACALVSLGQTQSATNSGLTLTVTRAKLAARKGAITLAVASGGWKIATLDNALLGTDLGPLQVGTRFCADLASANYTDAYSLLSAREQAQGTSDQFAAQIAPPAPFVWGGCTVDLTTYKVSGTTASYTIALRLQDTVTNVSASANFVVTLVNESNSWRMDDLQRA